MATNNTNQYTDVYTDLFSRVTFNCVGEGEFFFLVTKENAPQNGSMCIRISPAMAVWGNDHSEKVNYFNLRERKFGYLSGLEEVETPTNKNLNRTIKCFGIEH